MSQGKSKSGNRFRMDMEKSDGRGHIEVTVRATVSKINIFIGHACVEHTRGYTCNSETLTLGQSQGHAHGQFFLDIFITISFRVFFHLFIYSVSHSIFVTYEEKTARNKHQ